MQDADIVCISSKRKAERSGRRWNHIPLCLYKERTDKELLENEGVELEVMPNNWIRYDIQNSVELFFHLINNKLF